MAKQFKRYAVKKQTGTYQAGGEEKKEVRQIGEIIVFSDNPVPDDLSFKLNMYSESGPAGSPLQVWPIEPKTSGASKPSESGSSVPF